MNDQTLPIGAPGVGRKTLIKMLIESDPDHFKTVVPRESSNTNICMQCCLPVMADC